MKKNLLLFGIVVLLTIIPFFIQKGAEFRGADGEAEIAITEIDTNYEPWFSNIWEPPSSEIESLLFALQAVIGGGFIGYFIGFSRGKYSKKEQQDQ